MLPHFNIAVRPLVEFILRSGDLRSGYFGAVNPVDGIRAHQRVQQQRPETYRAEVPLTHAVLKNDVRLVVSGRVDGIFERQGQVVVEEIKTTLKPLKALEAVQDPVHWGQAKCYAFMHAVEENLAQIAVQLTYVDLQSGESCELVQEFEFETLRLFFEEIVDRYLHWLMLVFSWQAGRDESLQELVFPFRSYRSGQRNMAVAVYRAVRDQKHLLVQAATGIGKTMAALFPAVKALGGRMAVKVVFLTARTTGRLAAEAALDLMRGQGARIKAVSLTAKEKICFNPGTGCDPDTCSYAKGFFDRINAALEAAFAADALTRPAIESLARDHNVCPFELSLELVDWVDCVIGDYNYAFDPTATLRRLFGEGTGKPVVLVDEAHNLVDRSREMFSASLYKAPLLALRRSLKSHLPGLARQLGGINTILAAARRECRQAGGQLVMAAPPDALLERLTLFLRSAERWLLKNIKTPYREALLNVYFECMRFLQVAERYDQRYATLLESREAEFEIKLYCLDPSHQLREAWARCSAAVLFSATLTPADYFISVLGCAGEADRLNLPSPFPVENLGVFVAAHISTYFRDREHSCKAVSQAIASLVRHRVGNYLMFFPSYDYMTLVHNQFRSDHGDIEVLLQTSDMDESQREAFLGRFRESLDRSLVGFAVMGGIFGEGIDLKGDRLTAAAIVGVGLPGISLQRELIRGYYDRDGGRGFEFAYQYPGINRVLQAAGRVIRSEKDRGVILLVDRRYGQNRYRELLPAHWRLSRAANGEALQHALAAFWQCAGGPDASSRAFRGPDDLRYKA